MSTRRAARVSRATRTTRRTVEQQQLYLDQAAGDAFGGGALHAGGVDATSGYYHPSSSLSSSGQGAVAPGGGLGFGASYASGAYSNRHLSRGKNPARKWILVQRPPAAGVGFRIDVWVPSDQLTEDEKASYLPPSKETNDNILVNSDAGADAAVPLVSAPLLTDGAAADTTMIDGSIVVDATAPASLVPEVATTSARDEELRQEQEPKENDAVEPSAPHANEDVEMEEILVAAPSSEGMADPTSPNDRPAKRARFAHPEDGTHDEQGDAAAESHSESQPPASLSGPSEDDDAGTLSTSVPSVTDSTGEALTMPPPPDDQPPVEEVTKEASVLLDAPHSEPPAAEEETNSEDPSTSRKRDLEDISSAVEGHVGGEDDQEPSESDGPPSKRARGSVDVDGETAASINCDVPAASDRSAISSASARGEGSVSVAVKELPVSFQQSPSGSAKGPGESPDVPSVEPEGSSESR